LTSDLGKVLSSLHRVKLQGALRFSESIQIAQVCPEGFFPGAQFLTPTAQLALKHRNNKSQEQKIIAFVGSPVDEDDAELKRLALRLKKNKVSVDVVNFGEEALNSTKLESFIQAVNSGDNSHLVTVPAGPHVLSDILISSPIIGAESVPGSVDGVDPNLDPELALALRLSLEESQRGAQDASIPQPAPVTGSTNGAPSQPSDQMDVDMGAEEPDEDHMSEDEPDDELARAIAMSVGGGAADVSNMSEEEAFQLAMQMSMQDESAASEPASQSNPASVPAQAPVAEDDDAAMIESAIQQLPGVDPNSPEIQALIQSLRDQKKNESKK
jgi:26S proteasome regulatory subunit N10